MGSGGHGYHMVQILCRSADLNPVDADGLDKLPDPVSSFDGTGSAIAFSDHHQLGVEANRESADAARS